MKSQWGPAAFVALALMLGACATPPAPAAIESGSLGDTPAGKDYLRRVSHQLAQKIVYPADLRASGKPGLVDVALLVDRNGTLLQIRIVRSTDPRLNGAAMEAARLAAPYPPFPPGTKEDGAWLRQPLQFIAR